MLGPTVWSATRGTRYSVLGVLRQQVCKNLQLLTFVGTATGKTFSLVTFQKTTSSFVLVFDKSDARAPSFTRVDFRFYIKTVCFRAVFVAGPLAQDLAGSQCGTEPSLGGEELGWLFQESLVAH